MIPFARWVIRRKGQVELGSMGCNTCHTRVMADGSIAPGAQGNNPNDREGASMFRRAAQFGDPAKGLARIRGFARQFEMPWVTDDPNRQARTMSLDDLIAAGEAIPPGVTARSNTSIFLPPQIPDLIGIEQRRYLDHTGLVRHRGVGDLMRYCSLVQDISALDRYGDFQPQGSEAGHGERYSDEHCMPWPFISTHFSRRRTRTGSTPTPRLERESSSAKVVLRATRRLSIPTIG